MNKYYNVTLNALTLDQVAMMHDMIVCYEDQPWHGQKMADDFMAVNMTFQEALAPAGIALDLDDCSFFDAAYACPGCGINTGSDTYKPAADCVDMRDGGCGNIRANAARNRAFCAYKAVG